jgi:hypothetical protein
MIKLFGKRSETEKLQKKYQKLMKEAFELSKVNRKASDQKYAEADKLMDKISAIGAQMVEE